MSISGIQGQLLEVTVVGCNKLKDTEWISRQDPYVCVEYGSTKYRTRTCTDGGKNPTFQEKFVFTLIEGLREFSVVVWNSNTLTFDDYIGNGKVQLQKVLSQGYDDSPWTLQDKRGKYSGEVRLIMHYASANKPGKTHAPSAPLAPQYAGTPQPHAPLYSAPPYSAPPPSVAHPFPPTSYPPQPLYPSYAPNAPGYPPSPYHQPNAYPPSYPPTSTYPPSYPPTSTHPPSYPPTSTHPPSYPPTSTYPPHPSYPPPPQGGPSYYPPGSYPTSHYPPPPY